MTIQERLRQICQRTKHVDVADITHKAAIYIDALEADIASRRRCQKCHGVGLIDTIYTTSLSPAVGTTRKKCSECDGTGQLP